MILFNDLADIFILEYKVITELFLKNLLSFLLINIDWNIDYKVNFFFLIDGAQDDLRCDSFKDTIEKDQIWSFLISFHY